MDSHEEQPNLPVQICDGNLQSQITAYSRSTKRKEIKVEHWGGGNVQAATNREPTNLCLDHIQLGIILLQEVVHYL